MQLPDFEGFIKDREMFWMLHHKSTERGFGYNLRMDSSTKMIVHPETKIKNIKLGEENPNFGKKWTDEMKSSMSNKIKEQYKNGRQVDEKAKINSQKTLHYKYENEPGYKQAMADKVSEKNRKYLIVQFNQDWSIEKEWTQPELKQSIYPLSHILSLCNGGKKGKSHGFYWKYRSIETGEIIEPKIKS